MDDRDESDEQLFAELAELRQRVADLEAQLAQTRQAEADQQQINDSLPVLVATAGLDGYYQQVNAAFERVLGWSEQESLSRPFLDFVHPEDQAAAVATLARLKSGAPAIHFVDRNICQDGSHRWIDWTVIPVVDRGILFGIGHDITEQRRAEDDRQRAEVALRHAHGELEQRVEERTAELTKANELLTAEVEQRRRTEEELWIFRRFADASGQGFGMADADGRITYVNPTLSRWTKEKTPQDCLGKPLAAFLPPGYRQRRDTVVLPILREKGVWQGEEMLALPDGSVVPTIFTVFPVQDEVGNLLRTAVVITDITERKRAEEALRQSYEELRTIYGCMVDGLLIADIETKGFLKANRAIGEMLGWSPEELVAMSVRDIHPPESLPMVLEAFESLVQGRCLRAESMPVRRRDGSDFYADVTANRIVYDGRPCLIGFFRDVTERRQAEAAMRQALDQLATIDAGMIEGLLITDIATKRFVRVNESFCRMLGYSEDELLTASIKDIHPAEEAPNDERRFEAAAEGRVSINLDRPVLRKDGSVFYADITGRRIVYDGRSCLLALFRDVTERRQAEEKVQAEQRALRRMVLAGDHERRLVTYELHDGVAQQLLGALMYFQALKIPKLSESPGQETAYREGMAALRRAAAEIRRVMNRLRTPVLDKFGLVEAIEDVAAQLRLAPDAPQIECQHNIQFQRLEPTLENSLFRIAQEALINACRHSRSERVRVTLTQQGDRVTLEVRDWGIGFDLETVQENRFGLEGIRERSRILGGELSIQSQPGAGTVVRVSFPVIEASDQE